MSTAAEVPKGTACLHASHFVLYMANRAEAYIVCCAHERVNVAAICHLWLVAEQANKESLKPSCGLYEAIATMHMCTFAVTARRHQCVGQCFVEHTNEHSMHCIALQGLEAALSAPHVA